MEQSREEFEAWFRSWIDEHMNDSCWPSVSLKELAEMSWQASRESVVVKLPEALIPAVHTSGEPFMRPEPFGFYLNRDDVIKAVKAQGLTVK